MKLVQFKMINAVQFLTTMQTKSSSRDSFLPRQFLTVDLSVHYLVGSGWWLSPTPLKNDGLRQLGLWNSPKKWKKWWTSSVGIMTLWEIKHVPNHPSSSFQSEIVNNIPLDPAAQPLASNISKTSWGPICYVWVINCKPTSTSAIYHIYIYMIIYIYIVIPEFHLNVHQFVCNLAIFGASPCWLNSMKSHEHSHSLYL